MNAPSSRQLVVAALLRDRARAWHVEDVRLVLRRHGHALEPLVIKVELERLFREGAVRRSTRGRRRTYRLVALPKKRPTAMARLNHLRRTWRESDSCARKAAALRALRDELEELAARPGRSRSSRAGRNRRYRSELSNKAKETRAFCQRAEL